MPRRLLSLDPIHRRNRRRLANQLGWALCGKRENDARWLARFLLLPRSDPWYESLFPRGFAGPVGEITPRYGPLDDVAIASICALMPAVKLIYIVRNPLDQVWSWTRSRSGRAGRAGGSGRLVGRVGS